MKYYNRKQYENQSKAVAKQNTVNNSLAGALGIQQNSSGALYDSSMLWKVFNGAIGGLITNHWVSLTNAYNKNSFLQTAVNQKVEDAFQNDGLIIDSKTLSTDEIEKLRTTMEEEGDIEAIIDCIR